MPTKRIQLWSPPRACSTALMYSFGNRPDTSVVRYSPSLSPHPRIAAHVLTHTAIIESRVVLFVSLALSAPSTSLAMMSFELV